MRPIAARVSSAILCAIAACRGSHDAVEQQRASVTVPAGFTDTLVAAVASPTALAATPDGRLLVTSQSGLLRVHRSAALTTALDLSARLCSNSERGLLGVAIDPQFASTRHVFLFYTFKKGGTCNTNTADAPVNRVSRFLLSDASVVDPASELVLLDDLPSPGGNHNGGDLQFGADGLLYVSVGDGGCHPSDSSRCAGSNDIARSLATPLGKILRIARDGSIPATNPWSAATGSRPCAAPTGPVAGSGPCRETFAWGLRNPFRLAFRPGTSEFHVNDVGQNVWEEIDRGGAGADYGWNVREGSCANNSTTSCGSPPAGMTNPIFAYKHGTNPAPSPFQGCNSITGGAFVPTGAWPSAYDGSYLFGDFVCGQIFRIAPDGSGGWNASAFVTGLGGSSVVHLRFETVDGASALYYTTYAGGGQVRRVAAVGAGNRAPTAALVATPTAGLPPLTVAFDGGGSTDPDGDALTYLWAFGDGTTATTAVATTSHGYATAGTFTATLTVRDVQGASSSPVTVTIDTRNRPPSPLIQAPAADKLFRVGEVITLTGSASDPDQGTLADTSLTWQVTRVHDAHSHPYFGPTTGNGLTFNAPPPEDLLAASNSYLMIALTATDAAGASVTVTRRLDARRVPLTFATDPSGLRLVVNGTGVTGPTTVTSWDGYQVTVSATAQANAAGQGYRFGAWSDGGAARHVITTPAVATTYTASFVAGLAVNVNFQPAGAATPAGHVADVGALWGDRGNGFVYGWTADNAAQTRDRNASTSPDQRYDTLTHLQKPANPDARWELEVPNGSYRVRVVSGDPAHWDSIFRLNLEATLAVSFTPSTGTRWVDRVVTVSVSDGRLTLSNASGAQNNKVCFIEVTRL